MKRSISLLLVSVMMLSLMSGCGKTETPPQVVPTKPVDVQIGDVDKPEVEKDVAIYSEKNVLKVLKDKGFEDINNYTIYPTDEYYIPTYLNVDGKLQTVYVGLEDHRNRNYYEEDMLEITFGSVQGDAMSSWKSAVTNSITSFIGGGSSSNDIAAAQDSFAVSEAVPGYYEPGISYYPPFNTSEFKNVKDSNYLSVITSPLSTFAADVDTASYTNFRSILVDRLSYESLYLTDDLHDIRIEEMLNYFKYDLGNKVETSDGKFTISSEIGQTPWNKDTNLMVVNIKADELNKEEYSGSNLVFLIDTSGSMDSYDKIGLLVESMKLLVEQLTEEDTVSIVTYASNDRVVMEGAKGSEKDRIIDALDDLVAGGGTNGEGGIKKAYDIAQKYMDGHSNSRIIMCSDGDLNVGISSEDDLIDLIEEKRETGIYLSVLGFGSGNYKDNKMEALADHGNGNYYYIDSIKEGYKILVEDLMSTLVTIADDVKFQLEFNPEYVKGYRKIGYENREMANEDFADDTKDGGEVGYGHEVTVVYELVMNDSDMDINGTDLKYQQSTTTNSSDWLTVSIRYKDHGGDTSQLFEYIVNSEQYADDNSDEWKFISNAVALSLIANCSQYIEDYSIDDIVNNLADINLSEDADKTEFEALVRGYKYYLENVKDEYEKIFRERMEEIREIEQVDEDNKRFEEYMNDLREGTVKEENTISDGINGFDMPAGN